MLHLASPEDLSDKANMQSKMDFLPSIFWNYAAFDLADRQSTSIFPFKEIDRTLIVLFDECFLHLCSFLQLKQPALWARQTASLRRSVKRSPSSSYIYPNTLISLQNNSSLTNTIMLSWN